MSKFKPLPIGHENFKRIIDENLYYVDKTLLIKEIIDKHSLVDLFTRPRRFGKTLNMSMIQYYFEKTEEDNSYLFENLKISKAGEKYKEYMGKYPVISLSLKSMKQPTFEDAFFEYQTLIINNFEKHRCLLMNSSKITEDEKKQYENICKRTDIKAVYASALKLLSDCLYKVYQKKVIVLIDEYDVPLENAYTRGFYNEMVDLIRSAFESVLKTNNSLEFAILTGCLRVSKESIFTGLNNLKTNSIMTVDYGEYFGFKEEEVKEMLENYDLQYRFDDVKNWYDGYLFGETEIYNPWSIINFVSDAVSSSRSLMKPYWSNTSSNDIIRDLIFRDDETIKEMIEKLINGESIQKPVYEDITYRNVTLDSDHIWSFLLFTGYLKPISTSLVGNTVHVDMIIPNREIKSIYQNTIMQWFNEKLNTVSRKDLFNAVIEGDPEKFEDILSEWLDESISYYDEKENYYHGFLTGILSGFKGYKLKSNRETGNGRSDIILLERKKHTVGIVIEVKAADRFAQLDKKCDEALKQIEDKHYDAELIEECCQKIIKYGIAFYEKSCKIKKAT